MEKVNKNLNELKTILNRYISDTDKLKIVNTSLRDFIQSLEEHNIEIKALYLKEINNDLNIKIEEVELYKSKLELLEKKLFDIKGQLSFYGFVTTSESPVGQLLNNKINYTSSIIATDV